MINNLNDHVTVAAFDLQFALPKYQNIFIPSYVEKNSIYHMTSRLGVK